MNNPEDTLFSFDSYNLDYESGKIELHYSADPVCSNSISSNYIEFTETFSFKAPFQIKPDQHTLNKALEGLHLAAGVSYWKAVQPVETTHPYHLSPESTDFFNSFYTKGLAEFCYRNQLPQPEGVFQAALQGASSHKNAHLKPHQVNLERKALIPVGGGKDSSVSIELIKTIPEISPTLLQVGNHSPINATIERSGLNQLGIIRQLDPALIDLNRKGAPNGHVPVTGILSFLFALTALLYDYDTIIMSNESSASEPNIDLNGSEVNHQWSKSLEFETLFRKWVHSEVTPAIDYFSLLRPLSELAITEKFAELTQYHDIFISCNRAFRINGTTQQGWCCDCPKCRFVFLALAPFISPIRLTEIFGKNLLDDLNQLEGFKELLGLRSHKPFECVGTTSECTTAFILTSEQKSWADSSIIESLKSVITDFSIDRRKPFALSEKHNIPDPLFKVIYDTEKV